MHLQRPGSRCPIRGAARAYRGVHSGARQQLRRHRHLQLCGRKANAIPKQPSQNLGRKPSLDDCTQRTWRTFASFEPSC
ncbi:uncharacterized protein PgNI_07537 [Pyricularia grisea]|uniref:Uncharacterized protein n=1 Tax=Pyricularia grisea TaxID=148305 RepID=A0A6P8B3B2_PYRGI|nr:uncharacterized protein PgNI_07537 [Pyricularia grisea]TLD09342.1 hypothetical protein PgNI_07537 [Pyricularia grisea]